MKGAYIIIMRSSGGSLRVGALGTFEVPGGTLAYVGSAKGPGGLLARVSRHLRKGKPLRWHIDYLTESGIVEIEEVIAIPSAEEEDLAKILMEFGSPVILGFGCSDRRDDKSHLFSLKDLDSLRAFLRERYIFHELNPRSLGDM